MSALLPDAAEAPAPGMDVSLFGTQAVLVAVADAAEAAALANRLAPVLGPVLPGHTLVPGADTLLVRSRTLSGAALLAAVIEALESLGDPAATALRESRLVQIEVVYDGADLAEIAGLLALSVEDVIARHTQVTYTVDFLGFAPGFPYLSGLDPLLATVPRLDTPRSRVPAGAVGLAAGKTCVYPSVSPGGWRLLGHTDQILFDPANAAAPTLLRAGDRLRFVPVREGSR